MASISGAADLADGDLREAPAQGLALAVARIGERYVIVRDLVHARGVPPHRRLARG